MIIFSSIVKVKEIITSKAILVSEKAVIAIETALILPVLILMIYGGIQFTGMYYNYMLLSSAATEAARQGILSSTTPMTAATMGSLVNSYLTNAPLITFGGTASNAWTATVYRCKATATSTTFSVIDTSTNCTTGVNAKLANSTLGCPASNDPNRLTNFPDGALLKVEVSYLFVGFYRPLPGSTRTLSYTAQFMCE